MWLVSIKQIKNDTGPQQFDILASVIGDILILFHSSTDCERIFSFIIKTKTAFCHSISTKTLSSLTVHKVSLNTKGTTRSQQKHSNTFLAKLNGATYQKLMKKWHPVLYNVRPEITLYTMWFDFLTESTDK